MTDTRITEKSFDLLEKFDADNTRAWYDAHREELDTYCTEAFADILHQATERLRDSALPLIGSEKTMFRMARDLRFSKDKTPFNPHVSGVLSPSGRKEELAGVIYLKMDKSGGVMGGGFHMTPTPKLNRIRDLMLEDPETFLTIRRDLEEAGWALQTDNIVKTMPRGYEDHAEEEIADSLRLKSLLVMQEQPKAVWIDGRIIDRIAALADAIAPLVQFGQGAMLSGET